METCSWILYLWVIVRFTRQRKQWYWRS